MRRLLLPGAVALDLVAAAELNRTVATPPSKAAKLKHRIFEMMDAYGVGPDDLMEPIHPTP